MLQDILEHEYAVRADYIYGEPRSDVPFLWDHMSVKPCISGAKPPLVIAESSYIDHGTIDTMATANPGISRHYHADRHCSEIDKNLDDHGELLQKENILLSEEDWMFAPSSNATILEKFVRFNEAVPRRYPDDVAQNNTIKYQAKLAAKMRHNPEQYKLSNSDANFHTAAYRMEMDEDSDGGGGDDDDDDEDQCMTDAASPGPSATCSPLLNAARAPDLMSNFSTPSKQCQAPLTNEQLREACKGY